MPSVDRQTVVEALNHTLDQSDFPTLGAKYEGKVRDNYSRDGKRTIIVTDRISAFDRILGTLPLKGQLLNHVAAWWFDKTADVAPNHVIAVPDPNVLIAHECTPLPVEMVVRGYLTGTTSTSIWVHYEKGARTFCGHALPDGLKKHQRLPAPLLTPSTKAAKGGHDVSASRSEILAISGMAPADFDQAADMAMALFAAGQRIAADRGLILVDTKYELGRTHDGRIVVIDEIHTPDSSRYWYADDYAALTAAGKEPRALDKEYVRRWFVDHGYRGEGDPPVMDDGVRIEAARRYIQAFELLTGTPFVPDWADPQKRVEKSLRAFLEANR